MTTDTEKGVAIRVRLIQEWHELATEMAALNDRVLRPALLRVEEAYVNELCDGLEGKWHNKNLADIAEAQQQVSRLHNTRGGIVPHHRGLLRRVDLMVKPTLACLYSTYEARVRVPPRPVANAPRAPFDITFRFAR